MLCSVYTTIAGEYDGPGFCTPIGVQKCHFTLKKRESVVFSGTFPGYFLIKEHI